jgi:hypothetical protein
MKIIIKKSITEECLRHERNMMLAMGGEANRHVIRLLHPRDRIQHPDPYKIVIEVCEGGDMLRFIQKYRRR